MIKPADKGSATVVMSRQDYLMKVMQHLDNRDFYERLDEDLTNQFAEAVTSLLIDMMDRQIIDKEVLNYLRPQNSQTSRFYVLPEIHKDGIPGRPIISSRGAPTENISQFVDFYLHPLVESMPSYIKDTTDFLCKLKSVGQVPAGSLLLTLDVRALCTNIPHNEGKEACRKALNTHRVQDPPTQDVINLITLMLTKNNFSFDDKYYVQIKGTAMGTRMAPLYANIFMDDLERNILANVEKTPSIWWRYIDDIVAIWPHSEEHLRTFINIYI